MKMVMTYSANKVRCPTIEQKLDPTNILGTDKQRVGWVLGPKVVIPKAKGGSSVRLMVVILEAHGGSNVRRMVVIPEAHGDSGK